MRPPSIASRSLWPNCRRKWPSGSGVGSSYAANTVGAVLGAFAGGFILIPNIGVQNTIIFAVAMNLLIGCVLIFADPRLARHLPIRKMVRRIAIDVEVRESFAYE